VNSGGEVVGVGLCRASAVAGLLADGLEVSGGHEAAGALQGIAGFVPRGVFLAADDVEEVALGEAEVAGVGRRVVVEGLDDLRRLARHLDTRKEGLAFFGGTMAMSSLTGTEA
jgi:hypothetical protein